MNDLPPFAIPPKLPGEAEVGAYGVRTGDNVPADPSPSIFPIVRQDTMGRFHLIGTGFFITTNGLFVTARHVLRDVLDAKDQQKYPIGLFQFLENNVYIHRPILRCVMHRVADVAVGVAAPVERNGNPLTNPILTLTLVIPPLGTRVCTYAYPKHKNVSLGDQQILSFAPTFYDGDILADFPHGRDRVLLPGPCYQTSITMHGGASGGPVFSPNGCVFGVNSSGIDGTDISFVSRVTQIFALAVEGISIDGSPARSVPLIELARLGHIAVHPRAQGLQT